LPVSGNIARLFAASLIPVAASGPGLPPPPSAEAPAAIAPVAGAGPGEEVLTYMSMGNALQAPLGTMWMSAHYAAFEAYQGAMTLEFAGVMPKFSGYRVASQFLSGALVYRVTNADDYFLDNPTLCSGKPLKYIVARFEKLSDVEDGSATAVNVWLLSLDDYMQFRPNTVDPCGGDTFLTAKSGEARQ
jgi:hypothetical protein